VVAIVISLRPSPPPAAAPAIRVVAEPEVPTAVVSPAVEPEEPADSEPLPTTTKRPKASGTSRASGPDPASLTRAFRKQQSKIEACFKENTKTVEGLPRMQLEFDLDASGKALNVGVSPDALAGTALGRCLQSVGASTRFPGQGQPVSFAIPITASRGGG
jgi:hypothetical protein